VPRGGTKGKLISTPLKKKFARNWGRGGSGVEPDVLADREGVVRVLNREKGRGGNNNEGKYIHLLSEQSRKIGWAKERKATGATRRLTRTGGENGFRIPIENIRKGLGKEKKGGR